MDLPVLGYLLEFKMENFNLILKAANGSVTKVATPLAFLIIQGVE
jgi:hypothetical protein